KPSLAPHWAINCIGMCRPNWQESTTVAPFFAALPMVKAEVGCAYPGDQVGAGVCNLDTAGMKVIAVLPDARCGDPFQGAPVAMGQSAPYVVAPWLPTSDQLMVLA